MMCLEQTPFRPCGPADNTWANRTYNSTFSGLGFCPGGPPCSFEKSIYTEKCYRIVTVQKTVGCKSDERNKKQRTIERKLCRGREHEHLHPATYLMPGHRIGERRHGESNGRMVAGAERNDEERYPGTRGSHDGLDSLVVLIRRNTLNLPSAVALTIRGADGAGVRLRLRVNPFSDRSSTLSESSAGSSPGLMKHESAHSERTQKFERVTAVKGWPATSG